ncbi:MAG: DUF3108 domain-containing protein [Burkholderiales bacterium]
MARPLSLPLPLPAASRRPGGRARTGYRLLAIAIAASLALHLAISLWPIEPPAAPESTVLTATITEMPPPPVPAATPPAAKPKARPKRTSPLVPAPPSPPATEPEPAPEAPAAEAPTGSAPAVAEAPPVLAEETAPVDLPPPPSMKTLPSRVDLSYRVYYGPGLHIGDATYRFEHTGNRYRIATVGEARGLAALILRGEGKVESRGLITPAGLQPWELSVERGSRDRRETATFDWESGIATLAGDKPAALELPTFDPLSLMWQFYFAPPSTGEQVFFLATTRRVIRLTVTREGEETVIWPYGELVAERWHRTSDDGRTESVVWLAPGLRYLPIRMRITNTLRGTLEVVLASIRVDDEVRVE